jgi:hypothetical protein
MAGSLLAVSPVNTPAGAILTFVFLDLLFIVIAAILWALFAGWDWQISRRLRPPWITRFQTAIAEDVPTATVPPRGLARDEGTQATAEGSAEGSAEAAAEVSGEASESAASGLGAAAGPADAGGSSEESRSRPAADAAQPEDSGSASPGEQ